MFGSTALAQWLCLPNLRRTGRAFPLPHSPRSRSQVPRLQKERLSDCRNCQAVHSPAAFDMVLGRIFDDHADARPIRPASPAAAWPVVLRDRFHLYRARLIGHRIGVFRELKAEWS